MSNSLRPPALDLMGPWTIKSFSTDARQRIVRAAEVEGVTVGQWIEQRLLDWEAAGGQETRLPTRSDWAGADLVQCQRWAEVLVAMHNAGATAPEWLSRGVFRKAADALGIERPAPRKPPLRLSGPQ